jgi:hypothetical protein
MWTSRQRAVLAGVVLLTLCALGLFLARNRAGVSDPPPDAPPRQHELAGQIDPNTADWAALASLPTIGEKRAKDIVAYREQFTRANPDRPAFHAPDDLMNVKGIGQATLDAIRPFLDFPADR